MNTPTDKELEAMAPVLKHLHEQRIRVLGDIKRAENNIKAQTALLEGRRAVLAGVEHQIENTK